jgi:hypothetical protein
MRGETSAGSISAPVAKPVRMRADFSPTDQSCSWISRCPPIASRRFAEKLSDTMSARYASRAIVVVYGSPPPLTKRSDASRPMPAFVERAVVAYAIGTFIELAGKKYSSSAR